MEDRIDARTHVVGNYCKLANESIKPLIHRVNSSWKANMAFNRGFIVLKLAKNSAVIHFPLDTRAPNVSCVKMSFRVPRKDQLRFSKRNDLRLLGNGQRFPSNYEKTPGKFPKNYRSDKNVIARPKMNLQSFKGTPDQG